MKRIDPERIRALAREGLSVALICQRLGVSAGTVRRHARGEIAPNPRRKWEYDYTVGDRPILCVCGNPTPHAPFLPYGTRDRDAQRVNGIPWGFCSMECYEHSFEEIGKTLRRAG